MLILFYQQMHFHLTYKILKFTLKHFFYSYSYMFIQVVAACCIWCFGFQVVSMVWSCSPQTGHITLSSTPYRQLENQSTRYDRQQPLV